MSATSSAPADGAVAASGADFLSLPGRPPKPRQVGITHVIDKGLSLPQVEGLLEMCGDSIDIVKLGWGTAYVTGKLREKIALYQQGGIPVVLGGTFWEVCAAQNKLDDWKRWVAELGLRHVEISDGTITVPHDVKLEHIRRLSHDFVVLSEVGSKDLATVIAPYRWVELIEAELRAGAWKVITEARETGTAGIFRGDGEVRMGLIDEIVHAIDPNRLLFEAPQKAQQVWFIRKFGPNVNLGNIPPDEVIPLETLRLGLRADTLLDPTAVGNMDGAGI
ncbi:phosphosulfolactate synthase [Miltoncostaea marina]|uniref:phosphosulfolactate synthase n=1 Tax=Miltoncostaea marina TaxID=2843215 RepID=UPI001C3CA8EF|nr:phosphosulfolactate synthase [Miltoncostaea marina]